MNVTLLSNTAYIGAPCSRFYLIKDKTKRKIFYYESATRQQTELPELLGIYVWLHLMDEIREHPAPEGYHYDITVSSSGTKRIGIEKLGATFGFCDLP